MSYALLFNPHGRGTKGRKAPPLAGSRTTKTATRETPMKKPKASPKRKATTTTARKATTARRVMRKAAPAAFKRKSYRRNPIDLKGLVDMKAAGIGAGTGLLMDVALAKLPMLPAALKVGPVSHVLKGAGAVGLGMALKKAGVKHETCRQVAQGGLMIAGYNMGRAVMKAQFPKLSLGVYDEYADAVAGLAALAEQDQYMLPAADDLAEVIAEEDDGLGEYIAPSNVAYL